MKLAAAVAVAAVEVAERHSGQGSTRTPAKTVGDWHRRLHEHDMQSVRKLLATVRACDLEA